MEGQWASKKAAHLGESKWIVKATQAQLTWINHSLTMTKQNQTKKTHVEYVIIIIIIIIIIFCIYIPLHVSKTKTRWSKEVGR